MLLLGEPLYNSSRSTIFVPAFPPQERIQRSLSKFNLFRRDGNSTDVWANSIIDYYMNRPQCIPWIDMTLWEFASWVQLIGEKEFGSGPDRDLQSENDDQQEEEKLVNNRGVQLEDNPLECSRPSTQI